MEINRNLAKQKFYELSSELEYTVDLSLYKDVSNCYVLFLKEDENEVSLIPSQNYVINESLSKIVFASILEGYKYFGILENVELPTFDWASLESLSDLNAEQLNSLNENFETFVKDVYKTLTEYSPLILTNNINKEKYVFPKLKLGELALMGENGLEPFDFKTVKEVFDVFLENIDALEKWKEYSEEVMSIMEGYELGNPSQLLTYDKSSFVGAVNEVYTKHTQFLDSKLNKGSYLGTAEDLKNDIENLKTEVADEKLVKIYNTVADMQADSANITVGITIQLLGYYQKNDGAVHYRNIENSDDGSGIAVGSLWANYVSNNGELKVQDFGAKGDGVSDDYVFLQKAINYSVIKNLNVLSSKKIFSISESLILPFGDNRRDTAFILDFNYSKFISAYGTPSNGSFNCFESGYMNGFEALSSVGSANESHVTSNTILKNTIIENFGTGIRLQNWNYGCKLKNIVTFKCYNGIILDRCFYIDTENLFLTGDLGKVGVGLGVSSFANIIKLNGVVSTKFDVGYYIGMADGLKLTNCSTEGNNIGIDFISESSLINIDTLYAEGNAVSSFRFGGVIRKLSLQNCWLYDTNNIISNVGNSGYIYLEISNIKTANPLNFPNNFFVNYTDLPILGELDITGDKVEYNIKNFEINTSTSGYNGSLYRKNIGSNLNKGIYEGGFTNSVIPSDRSPFQDVLIESNIIKIKTKMTFESECILLWKIAFAHYSGSVDKNFLICKIPSGFNFQEITSTGLINSTFATAINEGGLLTINIAGYTTPNIDKTIIRQI